MKKQISILISLVLIFSAVFNIGIARAQEDILPSFDPNKLIDDKVFSDTQTFGSADGIQTFLQSKGSPLANTSPDFVAMLKEPVATMLKQTVEDPEPSLDHSRTAAQLIWDAAQSSGLNPQVILVTLNKEQSLITGRQSATSDQMQRALDFAMGFGCPDSQPCGSIYQGFYNQLFGGVDTENNRYLGAVKSLMKSFSTPGGRGPLFNNATSKVGDVITLDNTLGGYNGVQPNQTITLSNAATAALYRYTPHVFNGNYNFWKFFNSWFRYPNGTLIRLSTDSNVYMIQNGSRYKVLPFVAQSRNLQLATAITASPTEIDSYPDGGLLGLNDNTIISVDGKYYVFLNNIKHPASAFVISQRGLNVANAIATTSSDASVFTDGPALTPKDGSVLRGQTDLAVYLVDNGVLQLFTPAVFAQRKVASKVQIIPDAEIASYPKQGYVPPLDGSLVKGNSPAVYLIDGGAKRPLSGDLFQDLGFKFANILQLTDAEINGYTTGPMPMPANLTFFTDSKTGEFWVYLNGGKHIISSFVAAQKQMTPDYKFDHDYVGTMATATPIIPREGTIIKGSDPTVYLVSGGVLRPLTYQAYLNRKITPKKISILPQAEVDGYVKGAVLAK